MSWSLEWYGSILFFIMGPYSHIQRVRGGNDAKFSNLSN